MTNKTLSPLEIRRYTKQIMIPEIGIQGQEKLKQARALVIGAGGLGCPSLQYLTAAGVGKIGIVEFDSVDESNLQRQILYGSNDIGKLKSIIAKERLEHLNPLVEFEIYNLKFSASNSLAILKEYDLVIDATDNTETRYIINDASVALGKPMVHGSIFKYEAVISVFNFNGGPSYTKYNPQNASDFKNPSPKAVGLFGMLPGIAGTYMANEAIKIITGYGDVLSGKILLINILRNTFNVFYVK
jgi:sulfur-carrier protein adenylyltransferase/sulfurtransferase